MADIFISHAREDQAACDRLTAALEALGLDVSRRMDDAPGENSDTLSEHARATLVLWSMSSVASEVVISEAKRAHEKAPADGGKGDHRYCGLMIDATPQAALSAPFDVIDVVAMSDWFGQTGASDFDHADFVRLLGVVETMIGQGSLVRVAQALSVQDRRSSEVTQLQAQLAAADRAHATTMETLSAERLHNAKLDADLARATADHAAQSAKSAELAEALAQARTAYDAEVQRAASLEGARNELNERLEQHQRESQRLASDLDDTRLKLNGATRQQATLQAQVDAGDQIIRQIMGQREELLSLREKLENDVSRLTHDLSGATARATELDSRSSTYETALIDRQKELNALSEQLGVAQVELATVKPQAEALSATVKTWGHVPWRLIAAGSLAAGALITYGAAWTGHALDSYFAPRAQTARQDAPVAVVPPPRDTLAHTDSSDSGAPASFSVRDVGPPPGVNAIPLPQQDGSPDAQVEPSDQVTVNPDGLPPADPDARPPPQDLPPMQQKPRLILKPTSAPVP